MSGFFNLGSIIMGVISWIIPVLSVYLYKKGHKLNLLL